MKVLNWIQQFGTFCFLDNHQYQLHPHSQDCLAGAGVRREFKIKSTPALNKFQSFLDEKNTWLFGHLTYDLKNEIEELQSDHIGNIEFPDLCFFEPLVLLRLSGNQLFIEAEDPETVFNEINSSDPTARSNSRSPITIQNRFSKEDYVATVSQLKQHILRGDCYEINFCQEFFALNVSIEPVDIYRRLSTVSPNPYSALYRVNDQWLICASPERFMRKEGNRLLSQPMKGTSQRDLVNAKLDEQEKNNLFHSAKDRAENVMVVDLVRNDLAKVCVEGSVHVDELFGIYSFPQVHQMVSTVSGTIDPDKSFTEIIRSTFPMGSMTGAPKKRVMELIEQYERSRRGIFSGAVGYIDPNGDFDFNVVIRSILYNQKTGYLSFPAGSGITFYSEEEKEWQECLWKAEAIKKILEEGSD
jgi:para-aminobenzoate synthetase component I